MNRDQTPCCCGAGAVSAQIAGLSEALRELAAIRNTTEEAATQILGCAEDLLALSTKTKPETAQETVLSIMTACGFHDLVGQRVSKIGETLDRVIAEARGDVEPTRMPSSSHTGSDIVLEGPALPGAGLDQAQIDALTAER